MCLVLLKMKLRSEDDRGLSSEQPAILGALKLLLSHILTFSTKFPEADLYKLPQVLTDNCAVEEGDLPIYDS